MNPAIGSALAGIGLTVPVVVPASIVFDLPLVLGLEPKDIAMPALTFAVSAITLGTGRIEGRVGRVFETHHSRPTTHYTKRHNFRRDILVFFAAFGFLAFVP